MPSFISFAVLASVLSLIFEHAVPASAHSLRDSDPDIENSYIVKLRAGANTTSHINSLPFLFSVEDPNSPVTHWWPDNFFKGYSGIFVGTALDAILASPDVEYVEKNAIMSADSSQTNAPWNLQAISTQKPVGGTNPSAMTYTYSYNEPVGEGVDIYIADTGVYIGHNEFEGRASWGWIAPGYAKGDRGGHGTRVAGIAAGKTYGVAKKANIIAVKILGDHGEGPVTNGISGLIWIGANVKSTRRPSIVCMSLGVPGHRGLDDATSALIAAGVTVVVTAGNSATDASNFSPARVQEAITVGASDITNTMAPTSGYGQAVNVFAPGVLITSAGHLGPDSIKVDSGASMAAAHVAGVAAYFLSQDTSMTPLGIRTMIRHHATLGVISNVPPGTVNALVFNGFPS